MTALSGFVDTNRSGTPTTNNDDDDDDESPPSLTVDDLKLMDVTGMELDDENENGITSLTNDQELHVVFRISGDEYESVDIQYADATD